jgi:hypothetical protein
MSEILLNLHLEPLDEGGYLVTSPDLNGLIAQGRRLRKRWRLRKTLRDG